MALESPRTILVGLALGPRAERLTDGSTCAAEEALWLARRTGARLVFLHSTHADVVFDPLTEHAAIVSLGATREGRSALEAQRDAARAAGVAAELELTEERPALALAQRAEGADVDLVVIGARDHAPSDGRLVGSVATNLLRLCRVPVWTLPPRPGIDAGPVLAATDLTPTGVRATRVGAWLARLRGGPLHVVHAFQLPFELIHEESRVPSDEHRAHLDSLRAGLESEIRAGLIGVEAPARVDVHLACTTPARGIRAAIANVEPGVLVMGTHSHVRLAGALFGDTAERLLQQIPCSILAITPESVPTHSS